MHAGQDDWVKPITLSGFLFNKEFRLYECEFQQMGLVLEGGGMRGAFTCGVLDYLMDMGIEFPYVIGVSSVSG